MKLTRKNAIIIVSAIFLLVIVVTFIALQNKPADNAVNTSKATSSHTVLQNPLDIPSQQESQSQSDTASSSNPTLSLDVKGDTKSTSESVTSKTPAKRGDKPITTNTPSQPSNGIVIGGGDTNPPYNCKTANHHCEGSETHAYITNLELKGCPICSSHTCPSFYAVDEWGFTRYDLTKCPKYDVKKDPAKYCQVCGRQNGNGDNNTCQKYMLDTVCPDCGVFIEGNTCHTHP